MFRIRLNIAESKRTELAISATDRTTERITDSSEKKFGEKNIVEKLGEKLGKKLGKNRIRIIELIVSNPNITYSELAEALSVSSTTIENRIAEMSGVIIKRIGPKNGGHWEIIEN